MTYTELQLNDARQKLEETRQALSTATIHLMSASQMKESLKITLKDCVNELCLKCGSYLEEHLGACDGCRWKPIRHGDFNDAGSD